MHGQLWLTLSAFSAGYGIFRVVGGNTEGKEKTGGVQEVQNIKIQELGFSSH